MTVCVDRERHRRQRAWPSDAFHGSEDARVKEVSFRTTRYIAVEHPSVVLFVRVPARKEVCGGAAAEPASGRIARPRYLRCQEGCGMQNKGPSAEAKHTFAALIATWPDGYTTKVALE